MPGLYVVSVCRLEEEVSEPANFFPVLLGWTPGNRGLQACHVREEDPGKGLSPRSGTGRTALNSGCFFPKLLSRPTSCLLAPWLEAGRGLSTDLYGPAAAAKGQELGDAGGARRVARAPHLGLCLHVEASVGHVLLEFRTRGWKCPLWLRLVSRGAAPLKTETLTRVYKDQHYRNHRSL